MFIDILRLDPEPIQPGIEIGVIPLGVFIPVRPFVIVSLQETSIPCLSFSLEKGRGKLKLKVSLPVFNNRK